MRDNYETGKIYKVEHYLSYVEYGDSNGYPILIQHGLIANIADHSANG